MYDHHMHYPEDFNPTAPREKWDDGMVCSPGTRQDCPLCQSREVTPEDVQAAKRRGRPPSSLAAP